VRESGLLLTLAGVGNGLLVDIGHCCPTMGSEDGVNRTADLEITSDRHKCQRPTTPLGVTLPSSRRFCRHPDLATDLSTVSPREFGGEVAAPRLAPRC
jgi:hypothetical protein